MSFLDRLRECRYVSPSGVEHKLLFDELERSGGKKAPVHELPFRNIADVQDLGEKAETYPLAVYFTGPDYDQAADAFYAALREKGRGKLKHPRWGDLDVLPTSRSQSEKFVDGLRVARLQVDFIEAPDPASLTISTTTAAAILSSAQTAAGLIVSGPIIPVSAVDAVKQGIRAVTLISLAMDALKFVSSVGEGIASRMAAAQRELQRDFNLMLTDMPKLYFTIVDISRQCAQTEMGIREKVKAYSNVIGDSILSLQGFAVDVANLLGLTTAMAEASATGTLTSRADAMDAYNLLTAASAAALAAVEGYVDDPSAMSAVKQLSSDARARLLVESYSLPTERRMVLQGDSNPILLARLLYGDPERHGDIIEQNHLADSAIFVTPRGTEIRWYE